MNYQTSHTKRTEFWLSLVGHLPRGGETISGRTSHQQTKAFDCFKSQPKICGQTVIMAPSGRKIPVDPWRLHVSIVNRLKCELGPKANGIRRTPLSQEAAGDNRGTFVRSGWEHTRSDAASSVLPRRAVASPHKICIEAAVASPQLLSEQKQPNADQMG